jgi:hypothetical protein
MTRDVPTVTELPDNYRFKMKRGPFGIGPEVLLQQRHRIWFITWWTTVDRDLAIPSQRSDFDAIHREVEQIKGHLWNIELRRATMRRYLKEKGVQ